MRHSSLQQSKARLASAETVKNEIRMAAVIFDIPSQAVIGTMLDGTIVYWGSGAEMLYGWAAEEVMGRDILGVTPSDLSAAQGASIMKQLQNGHTWTGEFSVRGRNGESFTVHVRDIPVRDENDDLIGMIGVSRRP